MSQNDKVLDYMRTHKGITSLDAFRDLGISRLSARIKDLRTAGHVIHAERIEVPNRDGEFCNVAFYQLIREARHD